MKTKNLKRKPEPPVGGSLKPVGSAPAGELRILEYELGQVTTELAKMCSHIDNIQKRLGQAIPPNAEVSSGVKTP